MKLAIWANHTSLSQQVKKNVEQLIADKFEIDQENPDSVISVGGDGTLLSAFHHYTKLGKQPNFVALHTGSLGFYTDFLVEDIQQLIHCLSQPEQKVYSYPLLAITVHDTAVQHYLALNELTLKTISGTFVCEIAIGNELFETFRGDGICVSTPTGSTGLSKSLGGAVVHPKVEAMQMVEIAAINNVVYRTIGAPLIFPKNEVITLDVKAGQKVMIAIDNCDPILLNSDEKLKIDVTLASERIQFLDYKQIEFWSRVEKSFIGAGLEKQQ